MNISIIIPNYNGEKLLRKNLPLVYQAAQNYSKGKVEIIIPDDPSTDDSSKVIREFTEKLNGKIVIKTISNQNKKLAGFSKNVNRGVSLATGDIMVLLNTDVAPDKNFLNFITDHFLNPKVFAVGFLEQSHEKGQVIDRGAGIGLWYKGFLLHKKGDPKKNYTFWASGGSSAFNRQIWYKLGGLDEIYNPFYWEDIDLSYRAQKSGYKIIFENRSRVDHYHDEGAIRTQNKKKSINRISIRNQFIFVWLNITDNDLLINHLFWLPFHLLTAIKNRDSNFILAFIDSLYKIPQILLHKKKYSKHFKLSDKEVIYRNKN